MALLLAIALACTPHGNERVESFDTAKRLLLQHVYQDHAVTFYCGCSFDATKAVDHKACGYVPRNARNQRAGRIEIEHIVPAEAFGRAFPEWRNGHAECVKKGKSFRGRDCAERVSGRYKLMQADLHNLTPAIGEVNQYRSNYKMAELPGEARRFGQCNVEIAAGAIEPSDSIRGDVARTYRYMQQTYCVELISRRMKRLFEAWERDDPVDRWECERERRIAKIQGNRNLIVADACRRAGL